MDHALLTSLTCHKFFLCLKYLLSYLVFLVNPHACECSVAQLCPILWNSMDYHPPGSSVHGIFQTRILEHVAISYYRGSPWPRDWNRVSCVFCIGRWILYHWATGEALVNPHWLFNSICHLEEACLNLSGNIRFSFLCVPVESYLKGNFHMTIYPFLNLLIWLKSSHEEKTMVYLSMYPRAEQDPWNREDTKRKNEWTLTTEANHSAN